MVSVDRVYQTVLMLANSDIRGNVKPRDFRLAINDAVNEIYESYFAEINRLTNRQNRGLINSGLENIPRIIREKLNHFLVEDAQLNYQDGYFNLPEDHRYSDTAYYLTNTELEYCKSLKEFKLIVNCADTTPTLTTPICAVVGNALKVAPSSVLSGISLSYLRQPVMANWTFVVVNGAEIFNPSAPDFKDIDLHISEETNVILRTLNRFGINLKADDVTAITQGKINQDFNQDNAI